MFVILKGFGDLSRSPLSPPFHQVSSQRAFCTGAKDRSILSHLSRFPCNFPVFLCQIFVDKNLFRRVRGCLELSSVSNDFFSSYPVRVTHNTSIHFVFVPWECVNVGYILTVQHYFKFFFRKSDNIICHKVFVIC